MELYFIKDTNTKTYYIKNANPFFYCFRDLEKAEVFCNSHRNTNLDIRTIETDEDDNFLTQMLYQQGFKGGYIDHELKIFQPEKMEEIRYIIPNNSAYLNLLLFLHDKEKGKRFIKNETFYFFARINEEGYLSFANAKGYILAFTDLDNMDIKLAKELYKKGFEMIKYKIDEEHHYIININQYSQTMLEENFE